MTPTSPDNQPAFELPRPVVNEAVTPVPKPEAVPHQAEQASRAAELPGSSLPSVPPVPPVSSAPVDPATLAGTTPDPIPAVRASTPTAVTPDMADDIDLIEKEWVDKAKAIVEHTREDPHQQNKQLNEFKADYMKKRYGKELRLTDE